ncbi:MAG: FAD binding domain-containing protein, partial [Candidatus Promineifilaceae bacterium]
FFERNHSMKPAPFKYASPTSLTTAVDLLAENSFDAKLLAGGQSLVPAMNFRLTQPAMLIDINRLNELDFIRSDNNRIRVGAMTRQRTLERSPLVKSELPLIHETMPFIAHAQIRNRGTIGGSLAHADPASELPVLMVALRGNFKVQNQQGQRWIPAEDFFISLFTTALEPDEIMTEIELAPISKGQGWSFQEFSRRKGDYALMGVAIVLNLDEHSKMHDSRLVYLNAGDAPRNASPASALLDGQQPSGNLFEEVARSAAYDFINPSANIHASVPYLRHLAYALTLRGLESAYSRAIDSLK